MIESFANKISQEIKKHEPSADVEIMNYSLIVLLNTILVIVFTVIAGLLLGDLKGAIVAISSFALLRIFSGGFHFKSVDVCTIVSVLLFVLAFLINLSPTLVFTFNVISLLIVLIFSPSNVQKNTRIPKSVNPYFKVISVIIVSSNFVLQSSEIAFCFFIQAISLIRLRV
ncbi:accessory gene regulator ArgB-like protein [Chengkuizengella axinellae]|uniref:Accessory gene regulator B family protein n=1 Tax=Chengkuizengella axinellae TaxID=3064388 RepID=A0ABT9J195_9BACL|nr:accessory gene regulator B family protein [Chengkuizengella sp. 2205SS18-9]MDP5275248.1 accessory gene regulator B family protein [Chengkuizengella sp. 2205SS18-9]